MNIKTILKTSVAAAALFAVAAPAHAGTVNSGNDNFSVKLSGQFNKAVMYGDNGGTSGIAIGDNGTSESRFHITPSGSINEALSVKGRIEIRTSSSKLNKFGLADATATNGTDATDTVGTANFALTETWMAIQHKQFGTLQIGLGSTASDGAGEAVFNPAGSIVDTGAITDGDDIQIHTSTADNQTYTTLTVDSFFNTQQGGDTDNVTYITPTIGGFQAKASASTGGSNQLGLYYGGKFASFEITGSLGYENLGATAVATAAESQVAYSLGVKHDSGFSISGGGGQADVSAAAGVESSNWFLIGGYEANLSSMGKTGFAIQYLKAEDTTSAGDEGEIIAFGVEQGLASGVSVYAGAQLISVDATGADYDDVTTIMVGSKVSF